MSSHHITPGAQSMTSLSEPAAANGARIVTGADFVSVPTTDLPRAVQFYGETLGLECSVYRPERHFAEFETGNVTLSVIDPVKMGLGERTPNSNPVALRVADMDEARTTLESRGVEFRPDTIDTGVCYMAFFADPDGNAYMLHHRYVPRGV
jgi:predicted enzyme related to lactoylglutathione lyase